MQQYNGKIVKYTIQFMHTWILKDEQVATYIAPEKNTSGWYNANTRYTMMNSGWGTRRVNRMYILSKRINQFSLVYTWSASGSWNQQHASQKDQV